MAGSGRVPRALSRPPAQQLPPAGGPAEPPGGRSGARRTRRPPVCATRPLSLAESVAVQLRQEEARQEMQAKVAAQKLAERLGIKVVHYEPEGQVMTSHREVRDEEEDSSAED